MARSRPPHHARTGDGRWLAGRTKGGADVAADQSPLSSHESPHLLPSSAGPAPRRVHRPSKSRPKPAQSPATAVAGPDHPMPAPNARTSAAPAPARRAHPARRRGRRCALRESSGAHAATRRGQAELVPVAVPKGRPPSPGACPWGRRFAGFPRPRRRFAEFFRPTAGLPPRRVCDPPRRICDPPRRVYDLTRRVQMQTSACRRMRLSRHSWPGPGPTSSPSDASTQVGTKGENRDHPQHGQPQPAAPAQGPQQWLVTSR